MKVRPIRTNITYLQNKSMQNYFIPKGNSQIFRKQLMILSRLSLSLNLWLAIESCLLYSLSQFLIFTFGIKYVIIYYSVGKASVSVGEESDLVG